jgi:NAD+ diphosphatase
MQERNIFAGPYLDRAGHLRADPEWFERALADPRSRIAPIWNARTLVTGGESADAMRAALLEFDQIPEERRSREDLILLGCISDIPLFTVEIESPEPPPSPDGTRFEERRAVAPMLPADQAGMLGYARAMVTWRRSHRYCGRCGAGTVAAKGGHVLVCTNPACRHEQFPRIDPAIIVLVTDGERALLGRQAAWPVGRYSTIAGFVEPGESLEDAVAREVHEETGVIVDGIEYHSSQPWPFPSSLMLGFSARALSTEIHLRDGELEDARWFTRGDISRGASLLPPRLSISFRLIEHWFDAAAERPLRELRAPSAWPQPS